MVTTIRVVKQAMGLSVGVTIHTRRKEGTTIVGAAFFATNVGGCREGFQKALIHSRRIENSWAPMFWFVHDGGIFELFDQGLLPSERRCVSLGSTRIQKEPTDNLHNSFARPYHS